MVEACKQPGRVPVNPGLATVYPGEAPAEPRMSPVMPRWSPGEHWRLLGRDRAVRASDAGRPTATPQFNPGRRQ
ncbi:hypothetical protein DPMN_017805 [Dreissena polymorpha]|uniref:Uncharacterized protein n=1 Tax=Dreissena polymorpha TaxID=45954 RepID=A0A9D4S7P6_DREPO|nr:hypothetical protein DPMN_017805 [Dreissena polymorpha]